MGLTIGPLHVRRSILIQASPKRVWREFETHERLAAWFSRGHQLHEFEPQCGATVRLSVEIEGQQRFYGGPVLVYDKERETTFEINWDEPHAWPVPTFWTIRLTSLYDGTLVEIFHHGFERLGAAAADALQGYEDGWDIIHLKALRDIAEQ